MTDRRARPGPKNDLTDVPGLLVGSAHDEVVRTGATVILCEAPATCAVDRRGGGPGTRETDLLEPQNIVECVDALCFAGGSVYGLAAADAVVAALGAQGRGFTFGPAIKTTAPIVPGAILFDLINGGDKNWGEAPPYTRLGREALHQVGDRTPLGTAGAGYGAMAGALKGGQGTASLVLEDGLVIGAYAAVNSHGAVVTPGTRAFWAFPYEQDGEFGAVPPPAHFALDLADWGLAKRAGATRESTTLGAVATNATLTKAEAKRVAEMASAGFARAIRPVFAPFDGDVVFALATGGYALEEPRARGVARIGALAADCLARAIARGVYAATGFDGVTAWRDLT